jgi:gluconokinase
MEQPRFPISPTLTCGGLVYFPRMLDKIRLHQAGLLPEGYHENLGSGMDSWTCQFLHADYQNVRALVANGLSDDAILEACFVAGRRPNPFEMGMFNEFMAKRGYRDALAARLAFRKNEAGIPDRDDIQTFFDFIEFDENRL